MTIEAPVTAGTVNHSKVSMFAVISKTEYFECLDRGLGDPTNHSLKGIQDAWMLKQISGCRGKRMMEVGGGHSRVLPSLKDQNEVWNVDKFEGVGQGPQSLSEEPGVNVCCSFMGEFNPSIPDEHFEIVFSISVLEHVPIDQLGACFKDMFRCLKPGGKMYHAIDATIADQPAPWLDQRLAAYLETDQQAGFAFLETPEVSPGLTFKSSFASHSDLGMYQWTKISETVKKVGGSSQVISLKLVCCRMS